MFHRRHRFTRFVFLPVVLLGALGAGAAVASGPFGPGHGPGMMPPPFVLDHLDRVADELGLTEDQRTEIKAVLEDGRERGQSLRERHEELRKEGIALFTADTLDAKAIEAHRQEMLDLADEGSAILTDTLLSAAEVLTPEQRARLGEKAAAFHEDGGWRGRLHERMREAHQRGGAR